MKEHNNLIKIFKALSHPHRLDLYLKICQASEEVLEAPSDPCFLANICDGLKIGAPTISHHLKELTNAGLISTERDGRFLKAKPIDGALDELINFINQQSQDKNQHKK